MLDSKSTHWIKKQKVSTKNKMDEFLSSSSLSSIDILSNSNSDSFTDNEDNKKHNEEEWEDIKLFLTIACFAHAYLQSGNLFFFVHERLEWESHVQRLNEKGPNTFQHLYLCFTPFSSSSVLGFI